MKEIKFTGLSIHTTVGPLQISCVNYGQWQLQRRIYLQEQNYTSVGRNVGMSLPFVQVDCALPWQTEKEREREREE